ncbi:Crossover junction endonuclease eme1 [Pleurostoma richardsiae]|uniref:Crossover junction endonuclease eme1 n=1 Tax=Pleurostoma richardsiae TaxID=41990 RepID=A0AA38VL80_9PEZI|nr:Crossover junction endonuclease eme1 [Pleurostoma richardsiae]
MPVEVISLLSSSSPAAAPSAPARRLGLLDARPPEPPRGRSEKSDHEVLDLTDDAARLQPLRQPSPASRTSNARSKRPNQITAQQHDFLYLSDDFDTTGDLEGGPGGITDSRQSKKPRLSAVTARQEITSRPFQKSASSTSRTTTRRNILEPAGLKRWNSVPDPIESTSSPRIPGSSNDLPNIFEDLDDPFASSPRIARSGRAAAWKPSVNSLARSPEANKENLPYNTRPDREAPSSDPFASSPPRPRTVVPSKEPTTWDQISSSAPEASFRSDAIASPARGLTRSHSEIIDLGDSDASRASENEFPDLEQFPLKRAKPKAPPKRPKTQSKRPANASGTTTKRTANEIAREKEAKAAAKEAEKVRKQREKELAKEQKAREKEKAAALAEVNKVRTDRKTSAKEMIVDLPSSLNDAATLQIQTLLGDINVEHSSWTSPVENVVKWRRKVECRYDEEKGHWVPIPVRIEPEKHALVIVTAGEFVGLAQGEDGDDLESHVQKMRRHFSDHTIIYLIEGLNAWMRKNRNIRNRQFVLAVRTAGEESSAAIPPPSSQQPPSRRRKKPRQEYISEDSIEDALLELQVLHGALIHHTAAPVETAQWVSVFTQHMSTIPYRRQRERDNVVAAAFCMESGQVRTGDGPRDTYVRMLQEIARVTAPIAYGVAAEFGSVSELVRGLERGGPLRLEAVRKSANKDGAFSDRAVGQAVSRRIYKVFTGRDERSTDV